MVDLQLASKERGQYIGDITGSLGPASRQALSAYQVDYRLKVTAAIVEATVHALGLILHQGLKSIMYEPVQFGLHKGNHVET